MPLASIKSGREKSCRNSKASHTPAGVARGDLGNIVNDHDDQFRVKSPLAGGWCEERCLNPWEWQIPVYEKDQVVSGLNPRKPLRKYPTRFQLHASS